MIKEQLAEIITQALEAAKTNGDLALETIPDVMLEMPKQKAHGDWATGVALGLARTVGLPPRDVAARIVSHLPIGDDALIAGAEIAGPGFINLRPAARLAGRHPPSHRGGRQELWAFGHGRGQKDRR